MRLLISAGILILGFANFPPPRTAGFPVAPPALRDARVAGGWPRAVIWLAGAGMLTGVAFLVAGTRRRA